MGKTSDYYKANPEAAAKHRAYQRKYNAKPENIKSRGEDNKARKDLNLKKGDPRDASRTKVMKNGKMVTIFKAVIKSKNRGAKFKDTGQQGDKNARG